ncbi:FAD-dependent oxidoreductase [candidate division KSB1 bacterium]
MSNPNNKLEIVVIGASAAGLKAACRARRLNPEANVTVLEKGEYISYAACGLPYFLLGDIDGFDQLRTTPYDLLKDPEYFRTVKDVNVLINTEVLLIDRKNKSVECREVNTDKTFNISYDYLVISTGATPVKPDIPGIDLPGVKFFTKAEDAISLKKECGTGKIGTVAIIGGGYIGLELCEAFASLWGIDVTLIEAMDQLLPASIDRELSKHIEKMLVDEEINLKLNSRCVEIVEEENGLSIRTEAEKLENLFDKVIVCIGVNPDVKLAGEAGLEIGETGGIKVDEFLTTSDDSIFSAGDCTETTHRISGDPVLIPLGSLANRMGRTVGENISGKTRKFNPILGTSVLKCFDWNIASVGLTSFQAEKAGFSPVSVWGVFEDKAHYYPEPLGYYIKMIIDPSTEKILGVHVAGEGEIVRRIDTAAALMQNDAVITDFIDFEPAYAPPYGGPIDSLHFLAYVADGIINDSLKSIPPVFSGLSDDLIILDVRNTDEIEALPLPQNTEKISIPLNELRDRITELSESKNYITVCQKGIRSYEAFLILRENSINNVLFMSGGMLFANP